MKKVFAFICAMGIVAGASAQVKVERAMPNLSVESAVAKQQPALLQSAEIMNATKAAPRYDTIGVYAQYSSSASWGYLWFTTGPGDPVQPGTLCQGHEVVRFVYGSYMLPFLIGGGEVGYVYPLGPGEWYTDMMGDLTTSYVTGAAGYIAAVPRGSDLTKGKEMPMYYKLYNNEQISEQEVLADHGALLGEAITRYVPVTYPTDPDDCYVSDTVYVGDWEPIVYEGQDSPHDSLIWSDFERPIEAGDYICVGVVFPHDNPETDTLWNVTMLMEQTGAVTAEWSRAVYTVMQFPGQHLWVLKNEDGESTTPEERFEGFLADESSQPNKKYAVVPMQAVNLGDPIMYEPLIMVAFCDQYVSNSPNVVDRYVTVAPVPAVDYVDITSTKQISRVEIYSLNGGMVKSQVVNGNDVTVNVSNLNSGMYIAKVYTDGGVATKRIVVR